MAETTDAAAPALTQDPVIEWLERIRDFVATGPEPRRLAQQAIDRLRAANTMLNALREVAGDYIYLDPHTGREECHHCCEYDGEHDAECTMNFVFDAIAKAEGRS